MFADGFDAVAASRDCRRQASHQFLALALRGHVLALPSKQIAFAAQAQSRLEAIGRCPGNGWF